MSRLETPMTRWYWAQIGGTLVEECCAVKRSNGCSVRLLGTMIVKGGEPRIARQAEIDIAGKNIVIVQAKGKRLGMYLIGQAFFSAQLCDASVHVQSSRLRSLPKTMKRLDRCLNNIRTCASWSVLPVLYWFSVNWKVGGLA
jgi:hypothetical protein